MWIAGLILIMVAVGLGVGYLNKKKKVRSLQGTETTTIDFIQSLARTMTTDLGPGSFYYRTELKGKVLCENPLTSELTATSCAFYSMKVSREYEEVYHETKPGGERERKTRKASERVASNTRMTPFMLQDSTGAIKVEPSGADIIPIKVLARFEPAQTDGSELRLGSVVIPLEPALREGDRKTLGYSFEEHAIPLNQEIFVMGEATDQDGELVVRKPRENGKYIISAKGKEQLVSEGLATMKGLLIGGIVCGSVGLVLLIVDLIV